MPHRRNSLTHYLAKSDFQDFGSALQYQTTLSNHRLNTHVYLRDLAVGPRRLSGNINEIAEFVMGALALGDGHTIVNHCDSRSASEMGVYHRRAAE